MPLQSITVIFSPYHVGIFDHPVGSGPLRLRSQGLISSLEKLSNVHSVEIGPVDSFEGEIGRSFELLRRISKAVSGACAAASFPIVLEENCNASVGVAAGLGINDLAFVWFDAHADLDTPDVCVSGYFDGMGVSMMAGLSWKALMQTVPGHVDRSLERFVYCGLRDVSDDQRQRVEEAKVDVVWGAPGKKTDFAELLEEVLGKRSFSPALIHLNLDVLDESLGRANGYSASGGMYEDDLVECLAMLPRKVTPASLTVASFDPGLEGGDRVTMLAIEAIEVFVKSLIETKGLAGEG